MWKPGMSALLVSVFVGLISMINSYPACQANAPTGPLHLTPYISSWKIQQARDLSRVDPTCLKPFVPPSHSGFITVDRQLGNHLFFWYFPSPTNFFAPLVVWLNGGPGVSSMQGLLYQSGPIQVDNNKPGYTARNHSYVGPFSVLYIDNPTGVGYSYSDSGENGYRLNQDAIGRDLLEFMTQFVRLFPQYQFQNEVYIGGQSYAGKYIPVFGSYIHESNLNGGQQINLKGVYLAGPLFDPETHFEHGTDYYYSMGLINLKMLIDQKQFVRNEFKLFNAGALRNDSWEQLIAAAGPYTFPKGSSIENFVTGIGYSFETMETFMTSEKMRNALHVGFDSIYLPSNDEFYNKMLPDIRKSTKQQLGLLMNHYKVLIYNGDYDVITPSSSVEAGLLATDWIGLWDYQDASRSPWRYNNDVLGYYTSVGQFCRVVVHGAGHHIGMDQPESNLILLQSFVNHGCVF